MRYTGSCHCGAVTFAIEAPEAVEVEDCNCSICRKSGFLHLILPLSRFELLSGSEQIHTYSFGTGVAKHTFCRICGVKPFYTPRSNPDGIDINVRCLDYPPQLTVVKFDGDNWEENAAALTHKSRSETCRILANEYA
jgi:hypothetical protein